MDGGARGELYENQENGPESGNTELPYNVPERGRRDRAILRRTSRSMVLVEAFFRILEKRMSRKLLLLVCCCRGFVAMLSRHFLFHGPGLCERGGGRIAMIFDGCRSFREIDAQIKEQVAA